KNGDILFDVGAYYGKYSLAFLAKDKENKVVAFEPNPESHLKLLKNIKCNEVSDRIKSYNIGLSDCDNILSFYISSTSGRSSFNEYNAKYDGNYIIDIKKIQVKSIDSIIKYLPKPNHIKIDAEGYEFKILKGMKKTILKYKPIIYYEPHKNINIKKSIEKTEKFFDEIRYKIIKFDYPWICFPNTH
ncbi:MAG: FkbM family methyltransferase, partial [Candidatus Hodarchaeota archaeon]